MANKVDIYYRQTVLRVFAVAPPRALFFSVVLREEGVLLAANFRGVSPERSSSRCVFSRSLVDCGTSPLPVSSVSVCSVRSQFFVHASRICNPPAEERVGKRRFGLVVVFSWSDSPSHRVLGEERICTRRPGIGPELHVNLIKVFFSVTCFVFVPCSLKFCAPKLFGVVSHETHGFGLKPLFYACFYHFVLW